MKNICCKPRRFFKKREKGQSSSPVESTGSGFWSESLLWRNYRLQAGRDCAGRREEGREGGREGGGGRVCVGWPGVQGVLPPPCL